MIIFTNFEQGSQEWLEARAGKVTGTDSATLLVKGRSGILGEAAVTLMYKKAAEVILGIDEYEPRDTPAMARGRDMERFAIEAYQDETWQQVDTPAFCQLDEFFGYSPDGHIGEDGGIEIKCPLGPEYLRYFDTREIPKPHMAQMQWGMYLSGRKWWDYVVYHPDMPVSLIIQRIEADAAMFAQWDVTTAEWRARLAELLNKMNDGD
jgi:hypothetical protein